MILLRGVLVLYCESNQDSRTFLNCVRLTLDITDSSSVLIPYVNDVQSIHHEAVISHLLEAYALLSAIQGVGVLIIFETRCL